MRRLLRIALTWLLVLALPAQGYAAQAMLFCGPVHDHAMAHASPALPNADHHPGAHGHGASPLAPKAEAHAHAHAAADTDELQDADPQDAGLQAPDAEAGTAPSAKCSVCASCCSMAAIADAIIVPEPASFSAVHTLSPFEPHASRTADGLERPPKNHLA